MPTDDFLNFFPVVAEDADSVRARFNADANAGVDPEDPAYIDTTEGGFFWDLTQASVLEAVRLWDLIGTEYVAAMFPGTAWGDYLDAHGVTISLPRNDEVQATGNALFTGTAGTLIPAGTEVATVQADPSSAQEPVVFTTDASMTLAVAPGPTNLTATPSNASGALPAGTYYYVVTALDVNGDETILSNEASGTVTGGASHIDLAWTAYAGATGYKVYRGDFSTQETLLTTLGVVTTWTDTGSLTPDVSTPPTNEASITAVEAGADGNVGADTISQVLSSIEGSPFVTNPEPTTGGADIESDDHYRQRIIAEYGKAAGAGNISDYETWALEEAAVGFVTVQPIWSGPGTVRVIITDQSNRPIAASVVADLQEKLDPVAGQGEGLAPIGAIVTVATPTTLSVDVTAQITFQSGYSLDGSGGTIPTADSINAALAAYVNTLPPGGEVVLNAVVRQIMSVPGVLDVTGPGGTGEPQLNGTSANVTVGALQVAELGTVTLT